MTCVLSCLCFPIRFFSVVAFSRDVVVYVSRLPYNGMGDAPRDQPQEWLRRIANLFRETGSAAEYTEISGPAAGTLGAPPAPPPLPDLRDTNQFLDFFARALDFAIFRHKSRRPPSVTSGIDDQVRTIRFERAFEICSGFIGIPRRDPAI